MGPSFQMLWDCPTCGAKGLLGVTHRHCPSCGSPQDPEARYFPEPGSEVVAEGHKWVGSDKICQYCESPNGAASAHCGNCGAALEGADAVKLVEDPLVVREAPASPRGLRPRPSGGSLVRKVLLVVGIVLVAAFALFLWMRSTTDRTVLVVDARWERRVLVERFGPVQGSGWCDQAPSDGRLDGRRSKVRSHERIPDGESCTDRRVDQGDGSFRIESDCRTTYREEPIYDDWCTWTVVRWQPAGELLTQGTRAATPVYAAFAPEGDGLGARREAGRRESWSVRLREASGREHVCTFPAGDGTRFAEGTSWTIPVRRTGAPRCELAKPTP